MAKVYTHPDQPQMQVEVILASQGPCSPAIYTLRLRYPRIIHGEIMTHRVFSRNARSSRAVPVKTMLNEVRDIPFVPWHWGKNQKGMQADEECNEPVSLLTWQSDEIGEVWFNEPKDFTREEAWLQARDKAVDVAEAFMNADYHKQIPNRLLEPFSWMDCLITATEWKNFIHLRDHKDAEPHLQDLARLVKQAIETAEVQSLKEGEWHLPYITAQDRFEAIQLDCQSEYAESSIGRAVLDQVQQRTRNKWLCKISAARCARISYKPFDGDASYERELERYNSLVTAERVHASPLEHQAQADTYDSFFEDFNNENLTGNFAPGWIQYRKTVPGEAVRG